MILQSFPPFSLSLSPSLQFLSALLCLAFCLLALFLHIFASMGFFIEDPEMILSHFLYKTAVAITVLRWVITWLIRFRNRNNSSSSQQSPSTPLVTSEMIKENLILASFGDIQWRVPGVSETCAVCLSQLGEDDLVRELRNCCHYFHKECIDKWVDYNHHKTCPLCRAPLLNATQTRSWPKREPNWVVDRIIYLFAEDLHMQVH